MNKRLRMYVDWAGGPSAVAKELNLSRTTVWHWCRVGFPDTDFSGRTNYSKDLANLCVKNGHKISHQTVLNSGRP